MMSTAPPLSLTRDQISRLQGYIQTYRHYAFASLAPSTTRNTALRILQAIQGKLITLMDQQTALGMLVMTMEELTTLKTIIEVLRLRIMQEPANAQQEATRADLAGLKAMLENHSIYG